MRTFNASVHRIGMSVTPSVHPSDPCDTVETWADASTWLPVGLSSDYATSQGVLNPNSALVKEANCIDLAGAGDVPGPHTDLAEPLRAAMNELNANGRPTATQGIILETDGAANVYADPTAAAAFGALGPATTRSRSLPRPRRRASRSTRSATASTRTARRNPPAARGRTGQSLSCSCRWPPTARTSTTSQRRRTWIPYSRRSASSWPPAPSSSNNAAFTRNLTGVSPGTPVFFACGVRFADPVRFRRQRCPVLRSSRLPRPRFLRGDAWVSPSKFRRRSERHATLCG